jgi:hypothetical protein
VQANQVTALVASGRSAQAVLDRPVPNSSDPGAALQLLDAAAAPAETTTYVVVPGDTLRLIADKSGVTVTALKSANTDRLKIFKTPSGRDVPGFLAGATVVIPNGPDSAPAQPPQAIEPPAESSGEIWETIGQAVGGAVKGAAETITKSIASVTGLVDTARSFLVGDDGEQVDPAMIAPSEEVEPEPEPPEASEPGVPEFLNQLDNEFVGEGVGGVNMCTVTSLAMQLTALMGSADAVKQRAGALIEEHGGTPSPDLASRQTEDVVMDLFQRLADTGYRQSKADETQSPFYKDTTKQSQFRAGKYHQMGVCQAHVLPMFGGIASDNQSWQFTAPQYGSLREYLEAHIRPQIETGTLFSMSTKLTGGHFVTFVNVLDDGVVLHDPYGARAPSGHVLNGSKPGNRSEVEVDALERRFRFNPELLETLRDNSPMSNWGERNFFDWEEVERYQTGYMGTSARAV